MSRSASRRRCFALAERRLVPEGSAEGLATARVEAPGLAVEGWKTASSPA